ncbi:hypothetical protein PP175_25730 (plasmid) [Aneurinibacillus sp. Ricciae_BoGa-3]|uniref:hypothetical protein n=1 Tax=Aneurinibacillus sp. Ricciae_BoGa-3 TaxID=3022697 RepID=UPI002342445D|nr:hypothetical protein [Aneurinibacillus sp. Ricciae_BoGa-3]WCK57469.1 hypothetical protein PP175_25730 [Aneurinibacillus sp. Ricciae_BoGa-3]
MNKKAEFGSYEAHQPNYENFKQLGKLDDFIFQSLAHMGNASSQMSWANTVLENEKHVPNELKEEMRCVTAQINALQEKLRMYQIVN